MAYIGKTPTVGNFQKCDAITVVNGQAAYTLQVGSANVSPESVNHMIVSLNGVIQAPTTAYTVAGATLTFASNLATGDVIDFVLLLGNVLDIGTPSDNTVATAKIQDDAVTLAKMAAGTDGQIITYDASGNPSAVGPGTDGQVLTSTGAGSPPAFEAVGGTTPSFYAYQSADLNTFDDMVYTKILFNTEIFDSDGTYDNSTNYRWTPGTAGKYFLFSQVGAYYSNGCLIRKYFIAIYKNGSLLEEQNWEGNVSATNHNDTRVQAKIFAIVDSDADDYYEIFFKFTADEYTGSGNDQYRRILAGSHLTNFGGFKVG